MLSLTNVIDISVTQTPTGLGLMNVNNLALFTHENPSGWEAGQLYGVYVSAEDVATDFGTSSETYLQAVAIFSQSPNILTGGGNLIIFPLDPDSSSSSSAGGGAGQVLNPETLIEAIARTKDLIFYCGIIATRYPLAANMQALADAVQAYTDKILFLPSNDSVNIAGVFTSIKDAGDWKTRCLFYSVGAQECRLMAAAYASRALSVNFAGSNTAITMNLKQLATIDPDEGVTQTIYAAMETAGVDGYVSYAGVTSVVSNGNNRYFDEVHNLIWFVTQLRTYGFNALRGVATKIPQTEAGMAILKGAYRQVCNQALNNGYLAPGRWTSSEWIGNQEDMDLNIQQRGYYIYSLPVSGQSVADRAARRAPLVQIAVKQAGALHRSSVLVNVNR